MGRGDGSARDDRCWPYCDYGSSVGLFQPFTCLSKLTASSSSGTAFLVCAQIAAQRDGGDVARECHLPIRDCFCPSPRLTSGIVNAIRTLMFGIIGPAVTVITVSLPPLRHFIQDERVEFEHNKPYAHDAQFLSKEQDTISPILRFASPTSSPPPRPPRPTSSQSWWTNDGSVSILRPGTSNSQNQPHGHSHGNSIDSTNQKTVYAASIDSLIKDKKPSHPYASSVEGVGKKSASNNTPTRNVDKNINSSYNTPATRNVDKNMNPSYNTPATRSVDKNINSSYNPSSPPSTYYDNPSVPYYTPTINPNELADSSLRPMDNNYYQFPSNQYNPRKRLTTLEEEQVNPSRSWLETLHPSPARSSSKYSISDFVTSYGSRANSVLRQMDLVVPMSQQRASSTVLGANQAPLQNEQPTRGSYSNWYV